MLVDPVLPSLLLPFLGALALAVSPADAAARTPAPAEPVLPSLPAAIDLRPRFQRWGLPPRRQGPRGTCSVFTVAGALEYAMARRQEHGERLSVEYLNWAAHKAARRAADGGFFSELWQGFVAYGICPETALPYREQYDPALEPDSHAREAAAARQQPGLRWHWIKEWDVKTGLTEAQLAAIRETLAQGWPVCGGFRWPKQARWEQDNLQMCAPEDVFDGHSVLLVGFQEDAHAPGGGRFLIRNSGGDGRDGALPYAYAQAYMNDAAWVEAMPRDLSGDR